jgi:CubicO group peptidase (beta-lactamase class C family)
VTGQNDGLAVVADPAELGFDSVRLGRIDDLLRRYVDDGMLPGWSVLVSRRGQPVHLALGGLRDIEAGTGVELDTIFRIYSMTKPVTSVAAMMLYEQGAFELTDPIARWLPEFADMRVWDGGSDLKPETVPALEPIRVWHLLTHTSGLTYGFHHAHPVDALYRGAGYEWGVPPSVDLAGATKVFASMPLLFHPGREWNYSVATDVLGRLVEVLSGQPLDAFFEEHIFAPLGMKDTGFGGTDPARTAALYTPGLMRNDVLGDSVLNPSWLSGGGGLTSTLADYYRFAEMLRGWGRFGDTRLLGDRTVRYMASNHLPGGADLVAFGRPLFAETPFDGVGFGLGFAVTLDPVATHTLGSRGEFAWGGAASTVFWVDPVEDITTIFMTQLLPSSTYPIRSQLRQLVYSALVD